MDTAALKELQWEQYSEVLDMKEVLDDSPMIRQRIKMLETVILLCSLFHLKDIMEFATQLRKMMKRSKEACTLSQCELFINFIYSFSSQQTEFKIC